ncbi:cupin domain-containing protein [Winogradskyella sp.]|uniref:cupin domain-containing protein n=1 Tax=Winogradskyella sp. TaxID=1883156 RepID=UPI003F6D80BB
MKKHHFVLRLFWSFLLIIGVSCEEPKTLPDPLEAGWKGQPVCEVLKNNDELRVLKCVFNPGVGHEKHYHNPHFGYTLRGGKFRITDIKGTREVDIPDGYSFSKDSITSHEVLNIGQTIAEFLIIEYK